MLVRGKSRYDPACKSLLLSMPGTCDSADWCNSLHIVTSIPRAKFWQPQSMGFHRPSTTSRKEPVRAARPLYPGSHRQGRACAGGPTEQGCCLQIYGDAVLDPQTSPVCAPGRAHESCQPAAPEYRAPPAVGVRLSCSHHTYSHWLASGL